MICDNPTPPSNTTHTNTIVNVVHMALRRRSGPAKGKTRNDEISMSQSNRGKDVSAFRSIM